MIARNKTKIQDNGPEFFLDEEFYPIMTKVRDSARGLISLSKWGEDPWCKKSLQNKPYAISLDLHPLRRKLVPRKEKNNKEVDHGIFFSL